MKRFASLLLIFTLLLSLLTGCGTDEITETDTSQSTSDTQTVSHDTQIDISEPESPISDFEYAENDGGGMTITKYIGTEENVVIPKKINSVAVTRIGENSFKESSIVTLVIPDSVTTILDYAFQKCEKLTTIKFSIGLKGIGRNAFYKCTSLKSVNLSTDTMSKILEAAFGGCTALNEVILGENITYIGDEAFMRCSSLTNINMPKNLVEIGQSAFAECSSIQSVTIPKTLTTWGLYSFMACSSLSQITFEDGLKTIGNYYAFAGCAVVTLTIPASVDKIADFSFTAEYDKLATVIFQGNAPSLERSGKPFGDSTSLLIHYNSNMSGWDTTILSNIYRLSTSN